MGKNSDLIKVLLIILIGMFIPFLGSITLIYGFNLVMIAKTFVYFLLIFAGELVVVYLFFSLSNKRATKHMEKFKPK